MAVSVADATIYIESYCVFVEDWTEADAAKQQRIVNVAERTLSAVYPQYVIPDGAVYEFANVLAQLWNDTVRWSKQGVSQFSVSGIQFGFKDEIVTGPDVNPADYIPQAALDLIGAENGVNLRRRGVKNTIMG